MLLPNKLKSMPKKELLKVKRRLRNGLMKQIKKLKRKLQRKLTKLHLRRLRKHQYRPQFQKKPNLLIQITVVNQMMSIMTVKRVMNKLILNSQTRTLNMFKKPKSNKTNTKKLKLKSPNKTN